jgi:hypothetical protein
MIVEHARYRADRNAGFPGDILDLHCLRSVGVRRHAPNMNRFIRSEQAVLHDSAVKISTMPNSYRR